MLPSSLLLTLLQLDNAVTSLLASAGIASPALAFAFQYIAANFMYGILLFVRQPLRVGMSPEEKPHSTLNLLVTAPSVLGPEWASTAHQPDCLTLRSEAIISIKKASDQHNITIHFPVRA